MYLQPGFKVVAAAPTKGVCTIYPIIVKVIKDGDKTKTGEADDGPRQALFQFGKSETLTTFTKATEV
jgi:hypothetical protein